jgi:hypothetical protein
LISASTINQTPKTTKTPNKISNQIIFHLKNNGSIGKAKYDRVENITNVIELSSQELVRIQQ